MNTIIYGLSAVGVVALLAMVLYLIGEAIDQFELWKLKRNRVHYDLNEHASKLRDHLRRIEFLEHCEKQRNAAENEARKKGGK